MSPICWDLAKEQSDVEGTMTRIGSVERLGVRPPWLVEKHGTKKRRSWRKLNIGLNAVTGRIVASSATRGGCGTFEEAAAFRRITEPEAVIFEMSKAVMQTVADYFGQLHVAEKAKLKKFIATSPLLQPFDTDNLLDIFEHNSAATSAISLAARSRPPAVSLCRRSR
jgi:tellurite resistance protein